MKTFPTCNAVASPRPTMSSRPGTAVRSAAWTALLTVAFALVAGCSGSVPRFPSPEIAAARDRWLATRPAKYSYTMRLEGFLPANRHRVEVDTVAGTSNVVTLEGPPDGNPSRWNSIDALYATAEEVQRGGGKVALTLDSTKRIPLRVATDPIPGAIDDEIAYVVSDFVVN